MSDILNDMKKVIDDVVEAVTPTVEKAKEKINEIGEEARAKLGEITAEAKQPEEAAEEAVEEKKCVADRTEVTASVEVSVKPSAKLDETAGRIVDKASEVVHGIESAAAPVVEKAKETVKDIAEKAAPTVDKIKEAAEKTVEGMKDSAKKASDYLHGIETPFEVKNDLFKELEKDAKTVLADAKDKAEEMGSILKGMMEKKDPEEEPEDEDNGETGE